MRNMIFAEDNLDWLASIYGSTLATGGTVKDVEERPNRIRKVTPEQIKAVAARYLAFDRSTTGYLLPKTQNQEMTLGARPHAAMNIQEVKS
ncbi:MAG: insulinase family protein, partial [Mesorhizobium sp.]